MKRQAIVFIEWDDTAKAEPSNTATLKKFTGKSKEGAFHITVNPSLFSDTPNSPQAMATALAHELGHVVSAIADLPEWRDDPRTQGGIAALAAELMDGMRSPEVQKSEAIASALAQYVYPGLDMATTKRNLYTYFAAPPPKATTQEKGIKFLQAKFPSAPTLSEGEDGLKGKPSS